MKKFNNIETELRKSDAHKKIVIFPPGRDPVELYTRSRLGGETFSSYDLNFFVGEN